MPGPKRVRRERTDEWASIKQWTLWPEQELYEAIRPLVLFGQTAGERAKEMCAIEARSRLLLKEQPTGVKVVKTGDLPSPERHGGTVACHRQRPNGVST